MATGNQAATRPLAATMAGMDLRALASFAPPFWGCDRKSRRDDPPLCTVASFLGDRVSEMGGQSGRHGWCTSRAGTERYPESYHLRLHLKYYLR